MNTTIEVDEGLTKILIHFDVDNHSLPIDQFVETAQATKKIIEALNKEFFGGHVKFDLMILPSEKGSFKEFLIVTVALTSIVAATTTAINQGLGILERDAFKVYIEALTEHEPSYWIEETALKHKKMISQNETERIRESLIKREYVTTILSESAKGFLQKNNNELNKAGIDIKNFYYAYEGKNEFYDSCFNYSIRGIGFNEREDFPIKRNDFLNMKVYLPDFDEHIHSDIQIWDISITSPNWIQNDKQRKWRGTYKNKSIGFSIEDNNFWNSIKRDDIKITSSDSMKAQLVEVHRTKEGKERNEYKVLRVLEYNRTEISKPMSNQELEEKALDSTKNKPNEVDLFNQSR